MTPRKSKKRSGSADSVLLVPVEPVRLDPSVTVKPVNTEPVTDQVLPVSSAQPVHTDLPGDPPDSSADRHYFTWFDVSSFLLGMSTALLIFICVALWFYNNKATKPVVQPVQSQPSVVQPVQPAQAVCADRSYTVTAEKNRREGLWGISKEMYGGIGHLNMKIFEANRNIIENPDIIQPGWVLVIPGCPEDNLSTTRVPVAKNTMPKAEATVPQDSAKSFVIQPEYPAVALVVPLSSILETNPTMVASLYKVTPVPTSPSALMPITRVPDAPQQNAVLISTRIPEGSAEPQRLEVSESASQQVMQSQRIPAVQVSEVSVLKSESKQSPEMATSENFSEEKKGRKSMKSFTKVVFAPVRAIRWVVKNPRRAIVTSLAGLAFVPTPYTRLAGVGVGAALAATSASGQSQGFVQRSSVASAENASVPTRAEVERAGITPNPRYTVPAGELNWVSNSLFAQPSYSEGNKAAIEELPRELASNLGLAGARAYNEYPGQVAVEVVLSEKAVVIYQQTPQGIIPLYLADCRYQGKPWANRLKLISQPPAQVQNVPPVQQNIPVVNNNFSAPPSPAFPGTINLNLAGLPQQPAVPTNTTQHVIYEVKQNGWQNFASFGKGIRDMGIGTGVAALGIRLPSAIEKSARIKADSNVKVASIKSQGLVDAAKNRIPDQVNVNSTNTNSAQGGAGGSGGEGGQGGKVIGSGNSEVDVDNEVETEVNSSSNSNSNSSSKSEAEAKAEAESESNAENENNNTNTNKNENEGNNKPPDSDNHDNHGNDNHDDHGNNGYNNGYNNNDHDDGGKH